ncbi:MAG: DoxX family protein [Bdellovibrionales bacterium]
MSLLNLLIICPKRIAAHFEWLGPLVARIVVGYTFMLTGWGKLNNLPQITDYFTELGIPFPHVLTPFVSGVECFGGLLLILGLLTRISGGALAIVMIVATISAKWSDVDSLETLFGFEEATYFAVFTWLAICGAGKASIDYWLEQRMERASHS